MISVAANTACPSPEAAEKAVNEVWESCFADTRPFDEVGFAQWCLSSRLLTFIPHADILECAVSCSLGILRTHSGYYRSAVDYIVR